MSLCLMTTADLTPELSQEAAAFKLKSHMEYIHFVRKASELSVKTTIDNF